MDNVKKTQTLIQIDMDNDLRYPCLFVGVFVSYLRYPCLFVGVFVSYLRYPCLFV
jgi:hypothetical protein